jgi:hypothetical protein
MEPQPDQLALGRCSGGRFGGFVCVGSGRSSGGRGFLVLQGRFQLCDVGFQTIDFLLLVVNLRLLGVQLGLSLMIVRIAGL